MANIIDLLKDILTQTHSPKIKTVSDFKVLVGGAGGVGDVYSEHTTAGTAWEFHGVAKERGGSGLILNANALLETTALTPRLVLFLFTAPPTCILNDNVENTAVVFADRHNYVKKIDFPAMEDIGTGMSETAATPSTTGNLPIAFTCHPNSNTLYGVVASRDALTPTALDELKINLDIEQY